MVADLAYWSQLCDQYADYGRYYCEGVSRKSKVEVHQEKTSRIYARNEKIEVRESRTFVYGDE